ncbi:MAG: hypothetical protein ABR899_09155 [Candidatus Krumholzibacteriaceae bacterium]|jgi:hypothetical protein
MAHRIAARVSAFLLRRNAAAALLVIATAFVVVHGPRVGANFHETQWEDAQFLRHYETAIQSLPDCFTRMSVFQGLYRPLTTNLYYFAGEKLFGGRIEVYHAISVVVYLANGFLLYLICLNLLPGLWAYGPPIIFVSRFSNVEILRNSVEFQSLLSTFFVLLALKLFIESRARGRWLFGLLSMAAFGLALFSRETAAVFPALLVVYGWLLDRQFSVWRYLVAILAACLLIGLFALAFLSVVNHTKAPLTYDVSFSNIVRNYSAYLLAFMNILTYRLQSVLMVPAIYDLSSALWMRTALTVLFGACAVFFVIQRRLRGRYADSARVFAFGLLLFAIVTAPYVVLHERLFMRYGYFGCAGLAISSGILLQEIATSIMVLVR